MVRWRNGFAWALAGSAGLALLLVLACHPGIALGTPTGMSAPAPPAQSIESTPAAHFLAPQFDTHPLEIRASHRAPALISIGVERDAQTACGPVPSNYAPLHRRPPPSFS